MPANQRQQTAQIPASPTAKATAKYTNKDGSKFIKVPKNFPVSDSSETSPAMAQTTTKANGQIQIPSPEPNGSAPAGNRKKQKRRQKQAAKLAAQAGDHHLSTAVDMQREVSRLEAQLRQSGLDDHRDLGKNGQFDPADGDPYDSDDDEGDGYSGSYGHDASPPNGYAMPPQNTSGKKSKKKKKSKSGQHAAEQNHVGTNSMTHNHLSLPHGSLPPLPTTGSIVRGPGISKEKIWNTSSQEERERIKEFWLSLGEEERKSLVKVEKDAVLKKMKEQQKHSCSCTVCGRKRTAIEEELEVLYDAYYEELEQYANNQGGDGPPMMPPPRRFGAMSGLQPPHRLPPVFSGQQPSRGRIIEHVGDDEDDEGDEEYSEDDADEDEYSEEEPEEPPRSHATDFFNFGNSLTVQGGILTVADDLLKNDGKKFIEMMEQLAERRMAREEESKMDHYANMNYGHPPNGSMPHVHGHNHPPPADEDDYDDEEEEEDDYDSQDEEYDEEEMDTMTEEQRMEEGRRMFQIFAARMFEQRVLTAYKEKVAKERQQKLLEELEEETRADSQKKAKKAKDAQKKKEKLAQKKQAQAEEKAKREAEKAAEEAALRAAEEKKAEEQRQKAEEKRRKKEAQKKAEEEERLKKEAEKQRRLQEQRERQAELERRQREAKEREKREREETRQKEKEAKEAKEREARERREKVEREKKEKEAKELQLKDQQKRDEQAVQHTPSTAAAQATKRAHIPVPIPTTLQSHSSATASPHLPITTPAVPKAPTPIKTRPTSQQDISVAVPRTPQLPGKSQNGSPATSTPLQGSPGPVGPPGKGPIHHPFLHQPQASSPIHAALKGPPGMPRSPFNGVQPMGMNGFPPGVPIMAPGFGGQMQQPMFPYQQPFGPPNGIPFSPSMQMPGGRGFPMPYGPPGFLPNGGMGGLGQGFGAQKDTTPPQTHSRQQSASFDKSFDPATPPAQPIARPAPIGRPPSVVHGHSHHQENKHSMHSDIDELSNHLGSSALLDDSDEPITSAAGARRSSAAPMTRGFGPSAPFGMDSGFSSPLSSYGGWGAPPNPFGPSSLPGSNYLGGWGAPPNASFGSMNGAPAMRPSQPRSVAVRLMICRACKNLNGTTSDGFLDISTIKEQVDQLNPLHEQPVTEKELLDICDTEGNANNGGGSFEIRNERFVRYESDVPSHRSMGAPGEIGSPIVGGGERISRFAGPPGL
ncbi:stress response protein NST1 [Coleophoma crateriformis]|uniref:Stress response protein NST1 n=1 Tax=Coleophoma crateriformis TaxID=565419 RepID=A0A3D8T787_9HELO|nr:stress response protein NST1 [Coleophoma crateriformis]